jgi:hypothetical protein
VTTPPQPASNALRILRLLSVGGADAKINGFTKLSPVKVVASLFIGTIPSIGFSLKQHKLEVT